MRCSTGFDTVVATNANAFINGKDIEVRVWDSTSERRYIVIPERPAETEGWSESDLAALVTRNSMIGSERDLSIDSPAASGEES